MVAPSIDYRALSPMLVVFGAAVVAVVVEAFFPRAWRSRAQLVLSLVGLLGALGCVIALGLARDPRGGRSTMSGAVIVDGPALLTQGAIIVVALLTVLVCSERRLDNVWAGSDAGGHSDADLVADPFTPSAATVPGSDGELAAGRAGELTTEVFALTLFATGGMMLFGAAGDLLTMFIALEVFSLPLYVLCGLARRRRLLSQEASLKYFLLGAFSSAFFLFGAAFIYGAAGTLSLSSAGKAIGAGNVASGPGVHSAGADSTLALIGLALLAVGLLFKVGAVPFGSWVPDVYQGAPTPVTAFMASATKLAAFVALTRVFYVTFPSLAHEWRPALWVVAIATMVVATIMAVSQDDIKRMFAYSSMVHAGFILLGVIALSDAGLSAVLFYLVTYAFSAFGGFALLSVVRDRAGREATDFDSWAGIGRSRPLVGALFALFLLAFAGIPLTTGFVAKFVVFAAAGASGGWALVIVGILASAVAAYFYLRVVVAMFWTEPIDSDDPTRTVEVRQPSIATMLPIAVCAIITLGFGIAPQWLLHLADAAVPFFTR
ncbi:NADH-quinone oxidoreductase subunit NuoN [Gordonia sp. X0973]|uniref:NADH-quinone oxidoreductase subunit NuoN n=1 Tax=Gordonia sp. X0973 TaxID=2742602 RepID=UPI000F52FDC6|nr:NADH-quinone oxidoreductase subunit NuoN [Gordonia sp. X0973]QKT08979.1 NADH-quinone oxidoreductase subunit NuoN [Gordonia sp. X0973]